MITSKLTAPWTMTLILIGSSGCTTYQNCGSGACVGDKNITANVKANFAQHPDLGVPSPIQVQTLDHVVYLNGLVSTSLQRDTAASLASQVQGVTRVENNITVSR